ncbi:hypothetical protein GDO81_028587 [Engystomops pustulosus]|uniref:Uncharacterized protein n=1 Tax=Engystomops pustulosus TaxID=76066 RepID=A0AAV6YIH9_ENGPU|nr:hypothetical protein GDO81_028587 [Engystomops pustulosus]
MYGGRWSPCCHAGPNTGSCTTYGDTKTGHCPQSRTGPPSSPLCRRPPPPSSLPCHWSPPPSSGRPRRRPDCSASGYTGTSRVSRVGSGTRWTSTWWSCPPIPGCYWRPCLHLGSVALETLRSGLHHFDAFGQVLAARHLLLRSGPECPRPSPVGRTLGRLSCRVPPCDGSSWPPCPS